MSAEIKHALRTRGYELDRQSLIPPPAYFRYMEHLRWESASEGSFDLAALLARGYLLVVVGQKLRLHTDLGMGVELTGTLSIGEAGRTSLTMHNAFYRGEELVARGQVTAVFIDPSGAPAALTDDLRALAGAPATVDLAPRLTAPRPDEAHRWTVTVRPSDCDLYRHANQAIYLAWIEDARATIAPESGRLKAVSVDYVKQCFPGDELAVWMWELGEGAWGAEMVRGDEGEVVCRGRVETG